MEFSYPRALIVLFTPYPSAELIGNFGRMDKHKISFLLNDEDIPVNKLTNCISPNVTRTLPSRSASAESTSQKHAGNKRRRPKRSELDAETLALLRIRDATRKRRKRRMDKQIRESNRGSQPCIIYIQIQLNILGSDI